jgi:hypothetical protein
LHGRSKLSDIGGVDVHGVFRHCADRETVTVNCSAFALIQFVQLVD